MRSQWLEDAESEHEPGTSYLVAYAPDDQGRMVPAAWAGYRIETRDDGPILKCVNNYVRREHRGHAGYNRLRKVRHGYRTSIPDLYAHAYAARHKHVVTLLGMRAETYLFPEPIALHEADGWIRDTSPEGSGTSRPAGGGPEHHWQRLTWSPPR